MINHYISVRWPDILSQLFKVAHIFTRRKVEPVEPTTLKISKIVNRNSLYYPHCFMCFLEYMKLEMLRLLRVHTDGNFGHTGARSSTVLSTTILLVCTLLIPHSHKLMIIDNKTSCTVLFRVETSIISNKGL